VGSRVLEFGHISPSFAFQGQAMAADSEAHGFDIQYFGDNACTGTDVFSELAAAAGATSRIRLASGVTNLVTRNPSVVATAVAALQVQSGGRAICGVGKGDSALAMVGLRPQRHDAFAAGLERLRSHLGTALPHSPSYTDAPRLAWIDGFAYQPVPVEVVASGPRSLALAATLADRITLAVGADPDRIRWALDIVRGALAECGRSESDVRIGAFISVAIDNDHDAAVEALRNRVKSWAHMASFPGHDRSTQPLVMQSVTKRLRDGYDYAHHDQRAANPLAALIPPEFAEWFGIGGSAAHLVDRLGALSEAGLSYVNLIQLPPIEKDAVASEVIPHFRG
jgi:5,10-methylenetetrahydromethanopterin reductase